jgi:Zinc-ribbon/Ring finger domain
MNSSQDVSFVRCMYCGSVQAPLSTHCHTCFKHWATYFCLPCRLYENDTKKLARLFHCPACQLCRVGPSTDYFHCDGCGCCVHLTLLNNHKCIDKKLESDCPICGEYFMSSPHAIRFLPCGHAIHWHCHASHAKTSYQCPICLKSTMDMSAHFQRIETLLKEQPMPPEYAHLSSSVLCNDCERKSIVPFHFLYHQCSHCKSFNTKVI